jgi:hypothetical protein
MALPKAEALSLFGANDMPVTSADVDGAYRYSLHRRWGHPSLPVATFVMLNPSTADAVTDDPTIRRCRGFARRWGCGGLTVGNLYALRATNPRDLWTAADPVGPRNDAVLDQLVILAGDLGGPVVAAWGAHARKDRVDAVLARWPDAFRCLGVTGAGAPRHPLYVRGDTALQPWPQR